MKREAKWWWVAALWIAACGRVTVGDDVSGPVVESVAQALGDFDPLPGGLQWWMQDRFPGDPDGDGVRNEQHDTTYAQPTAFHVTFDGCPAIAGDPLRRLEWRVDGQVRAETTCRLQVPLSAGRHEVKLRVFRTDTNQSRTYVVDPVVRDYLIVSLGDSFGAGEGAPDVRANWDLDQHARWANERCHRSFNSPAAVAARQLEESDPHSSVTYLSLACSGATIARVTWEHDWSGEPFDGFPGPSDGRWRGAGVLLGYIGGVPPEDENAPPLPTQLDALTDLVGSRPIDALVLSGGGNDIGFSDILRYCTIHAQCTWGDDGAGLRRRADPLKNQLPYSYDALAAGLDDHGLVIRSLQLMEYPELARDRDGDFCDSILKDTNRFVFTEVTRQELLELDGYAYQPLLQTMRAKSVEHLWTYVTGIGDDFAGRGRSSMGHGYCVPWYDRWINTAHDGSNFQGPKGNEMATMGTAHPNVVGYQMMAQRLLESVRAVTPELAPDGTLLRDPISHGIWLVHGGAKFLIPSMEVFDQLGLDHGAVRDASMRELSRFPNGAPRDGTLVHDLATGRVYVVHAGAKFYISSAQQFAEFGYDWAKVRALPPGAVAALPDVPRDGALIRDRITGAIYVVHAGAKLHIASLQQLAQLGFELDRVTTLPEQAIAAIPNVPRDGTLYRTELDGRVFAVFNGGRFYVPDPGYAQRMGWELSKVVALPSTAVAALAHLPAGDVEVGGTNGLVRGWAFDGDVPGQQLLIHVYVDGPPGVGQLVAATATSVSRPDVNAAHAQYGLSGPHGFEVQLAPSLRDGRPHQLYVYALDDAGRWNPWLGARPYAFTWQ
mgnify:CR=1 FL=1